MTEHHLTVARTARYYQLGELSAATRRVWFVSHGYGQLAQYFIRHFAGLTEADPATVIIAPEGLSRFYLNGNSGRVGASWMTRDNRLAEIEDHCNFLNQVAKLILEQCPADITVNVLGFSQGTATVSRWLTRASIRPARLVLWAGSFPDEVSPEVATALLTDLPVTLVLGDADEYISAELLAQQQALLTQLGATVSVIEFVGKHEMNQEALAQIALLRSP